MKILPLIVFTASLFLGACGDDDPAPFMCVGSYASVNNETYASNAMSAGACVNSSDLDVTCGVDLGTLTGQCAFICNTSTPNDVAGCTGNCVKNDAKTVTDPSDACLGCYQQAVGCTLMACGEECSASPNSMECLTCRNANCVPAFFQCSGLPLPPTGDGG